MSSQVKFSELAGKTLIRVEQIGDEELRFFTDDTVYVMYHEQDCCENVTIDDIEGDLQSLVGNPILVAEESTNTGDETFGTYTWTFYKLATINGHVDIKWYGESNGYYSEKVTLYKKQIDA